MRADAQIRLQQIEAQTREVDTDQSGLVDIQCTGHVSLLSEFTRAYRVTGENRTHTAGFTARSSDRLSYGPRLTVRRRTPFFLSTPSAGIDPAATALCLLYI